MLTITARRLLTPRVEMADPVVRIEDGRILEISSRNKRELGTGEVLDFGDSTLAPGYIDIHIHGGAGHDVMEDSAGALPAVERLIAAHGVTSYFPTTVTAPLDTTLRALERLAAAIEQSATGFPRRASPLGIHLEGPFLSHARRGVHPEDLLQKPTLALLEKFWQAARGKIRVLTIAPELDGAEEVIAAAAKRGVCVSLGHSDAGLETAQRAIRAGARHATHVFNAMRPLLHRDPGLLGALLADDTVSADLIADGIHLDPSIVRLIMKTKGSERSVLITDATAATGMPDGRYRLGTSEVELQDGRCTVNGKLAGSVLTMDLAVRNVMNFAGWKLAAAVQAASANPARVMQIEDRGLLKPGTVADIVVLDDTGNLRKTIIGGRVI